jgi:hypothetical protein
VAASSRWTTTQGITVDCPRCLLPLPVVAVRTDARASGMRSLSLSVQVVPIDDEWLRVARRGHPRCLPDDPRKIKRTDEGFEVIDG